MIEVEKARQHMTEVPMVDLECLDADVQWALQIRLDLPSRSELETRILRLRGQLADVVESGVIDKDDPTLGRLFSTAHRLVAHQVLPHQMTHTDAYEHLRRLGNNARAFAAIYRLRQARSNREMGPTS